MRVYKYPGSGLKRNIFLKTHRFIIFFIYSFLCSLIFKLEKTSFLFLIARTLSFDLFSHMFNYYILIINMGLILSILSELLFSYLPYVIYYEDRLKDTVIELVESYKI